MPQFSTFESSFRLNHVRSINHPAAAVTSSRLTTELASEATSNSRGSLQRTLPISCPRCAAQIEIANGLCGNRLHDAILMQAQRLGTELHCQRCGNTFVYQQVAVLGAKNGS